MIKKISDKDKKDWQNFISNKEKIPNKDFISQKKIRHEKIRKIDLHGYTLEEANKAIEKFILKNTKAALIELERSRKKKD